jgi:membrane protein DedA with SNARE-associated domain
MSQLLIAADAEPIGGLAGWAVGLMEALGGPGAALVVGLDNLFPPIPSELVLPLAGFSASQGVFSFAGALFWTTLGSVVGAVIVYGVGAVLGRERTRALVTRIPLVRVADVDRSERWFARHGAKAVLLGRMVPLFRSAISLPAGIERMGLPTFLGLTALGSLAWNTVFVTAGYLLGRNWQLVDRYAAVVQWIVVVAVAGAVAGFVVVRLRGGRSNATAQTQRIPAHRRR